eukprot:2067814-Rhodomonas_salina.1
MHNPAPPTRALPVRHALSGTDLTLANPVGNQAAEVQSTASGDMEQDEGGRGADLGRCRCRNRFTNWGRRVLSNPPSSASMKNLPSV